MPNKGMAHKEEMGLTNSGSSKKKPVKVKKPKKKTK